ncbi:MAG: DNA polymerase ligase N-terminal domain-containing protein [Planctomycetota bacterium]|jgi:hypothetical protein
MPDSTQQFVIQEHSTPEGVHWDLMLQMKAVLWTWRIETPPSEIGNKPVVAKRIFDHELRFLTYEGPVQNNTGKVRIADKGIYHKKHQAETSIHIHLDGGVLSGDFRLCCIEDTVWQLEKLD